jgi:hypothetical protein
MITLTEKQIEDLRYAELEGYDLIDVVEGQNGRWSRSVELIFRPIGEKTYYSVCFYEGLTECQEDEYYEQDAVEVQKVETITHEWRAVK